MLLHSNRQARPQQATLVSVIYDITELKDKTLAEEPI
jgi:hypothetical protein